MTTSLYQLTENLPTRFAEIQAIVSRAGSVVDSDVELYDILCRAGAVLIATCLEGLIKDINVAIQTDLNEFVPSFEAMPAGMQRAFANKIVYFEGAHSGDIEKRVNQLLRFFKSNSVKIEMDRFKYKENENKNTSADMIDRAFHRYGLNSVLHCLSGSKLESVFNGDNSDKTRLKREIKRMRSTLYSFPYSGLPARYAMTDWVSVKGQLPPNSIWKEYLGNILRRRHGIVHADITDNPTSWEVLRSDMEKMEILFAGIIYSVSSHLSKDMRS